MLSMLFDNAKENALALKILPGRASTIAKAIVPRRKEKKPVYESEELDEPPPQKKKAKLQEEASESHKCFEDVETDDKVLSDMMKLGFAQSELQIAVQENWSDIHSKLEETPLKEKILQKAHEKGKAIYLKFQRKSLCSTRRGLRAVSLSGKRLKICSQ